MNVVRKRSAASAIIGLGESTFSRKPDKTARAHAVEACLDAVSDAGLKMAEIDGLLLNRSPIEASSVLPLHLKRDIGLGDLSLLASVEAEGSSAIQMIQYAALAIDAGMAEKVLCVFADAPVGATGGGDAYSISMNLVGLDGWDERHGLIGATGGFALSVQRYFHLYGADSNALYEAAAADREWAALNPKAFLRKPLDKEEYFASRWIVEPLRLFDCAYPVNGAVAVIVSGAESAADGPNPPVYVHGFGQGHSGARNFAGAEPEIQTGAGIAGRNLFGGLGITPGACDFCEFYNPFSITTILALEGYGFCKPGEGVDFIAGRATRPGGALPTNTGGGHLSSYYLQGMTPVHEAIVQIRRCGGERQVPSNNLGLVTGFGGRMEYHSAMTVSPHREI
ncbi:thiolase family protein [Henriciella sp.]|jgi:acetyl-CoA acetyltransferase|uniref:thiolase family protein n=2 Tax=Henriciella TaxID=453849 RepID=UPI0035132E2C